MKMLAKKPNIFQSSGSGGRVITFSLNRDSFSLFSNIGFKADGNVACGKHYFPVRYCPTSPCTQSRHRYNRGVCCDGVFYPGSGCCSSADCQDSACFDGVCVISKPGSLANTLPSGHQRFLIVLSDFSDITHDPSTFCTNRYKQWKGRLKLADFEAYYDKVSQQFTGRPATKYEYTVLAGINTSDFNPTGGKTLSAMHKALEDYLVSKGCIKGTADFDKKLLISSKLDLNGFTGYTITGGRIGMKSINMYLFVHELTHTYGATDLYLNLGGQLQYLFDLMGSNLGSYGIPEFAVSWGQISWGDINQNGVIDLFEFATYPDALVAVRHSAKLFPQGYLEVGVEVVAMEGGVEKRAFIRDYIVELPDYNVRRTSLPGAVLTFGKLQVDLEDIRKKGSLKVRVIATYTYTDQNFKRKELKLSSDKVVTVTR